MSYARGFMLALPILAILFVAAFASSARVSADQEIVVRQGSSSVEISTDWVQVSSDHGGVEVSTDSVDVSTDEGAKGSTSQEVVVQQGSSASPNDTSGDTATFRLCGVDDPDAEREIERFIAGRNFRARLVSRSDGCADLIISVSHTLAGGSQTTSFRTSSGSGPEIAVRIVTENGTTRASIAGSG
jgi:hypothetical protein